MLECIGPLRKPTRPPLLYPVLPHLLAIIVPHYSPPQNPRTAVCREQSRFHRWIGWTLTLEGVTGRIVNLFARVVDPALAVHRIAVALESQDQGAVRAQTAKLHWFVAHAPAPLDAYGKPIVKGAGQIAVRRYTQRWRHPFVTAARRLTSCRSLKQFAFSGARIARRRRE
jgi:hypothetical protein